MDLIRIRGLELDCIVGLRPLEREREQRVHLDVAMGMDLSPAGRAGRIALTCDYSEIAEEIIALLRFRKYQLIEMATEEIAAMLLGVHGALDHVELRLDKPAALDGRARAASVEIRRPRAAFPVTARHTPFGSAETVLETREARLQLLRVEPGRELPGAYARGARSLEWLVSGSLLHGGQPLPRFVPAAVEDGAPPYVASGAEPAVLFRCTCPPVDGG